ncbi:MAG: AbrB family transcriptional regulator [Betaproteobacteria bacterium]
MPAVSKIAANGRTTVPQEIRAAFKSKPGDLITWEVEPDGRVAVRGIQPAGMEYPEAVAGMLCEWQSGRCTDVEIVDYH